MTVHIYEHFYFESGDVSARGDKDTRELRYTVTGTNDRDEVLLKVLAEIDTTHDDLDLQTILPRQIGHECWDVLVNYATAITQQFRWQVDTTGNTQRITHGLSETRYAAPGVTLPQMDGALNVQDGRIEGYDKVIPGMKFQISDNVDPDLIDDAWLILVENLTGTVNRDPELNRAAETLLFLGMTGGQTTSGFPEFTWHFVAGRHIQNLTIGTVTGIYKKAHQYMWPRWQEQIDTPANKVRKFLAGVYVNDVPEIADWAGLIPGII